MITPRITSMRFSCAPQRKLPKAGDMRWLKGKKVWQVRQQEKHGRCYVVSNGRPVWEWVDRGGDRDREWRYSSSHSTENDTEGRRYFEQGCLCLIEGKFSILPSESNAKAVARYMAECKCSRHPEHGRASQ